MTASWPSVRAAHWSFGSASSCRTARPCRSTICRRRTRKAIRASRDDVDYHTWALLKGVAVSTLLGIGTQLSLGGTQQSDLVTAIRQSTQDSINQAGQQITQKNLNIQPTIKVRPGWPLRVIVHKDLVLRPYRG